ncbi:MAG: hypothetical protein ACXWV0_05490, partial [Flavisolibacter sp.]
MKILITILLILFVAGLSQTSAQQQTKKFDFFGESIELPVPPPLIFEGPLSVSTIQAFHDKINTTEYISLLTPLLAYKKKFQPDDWLYYQLVRKAAESISPKKENYHRYTLFKWFFLTRSGYDAILALSGNMIFFYAASDNNIYNIPTRISNGKSYI